MTLKNLDKANNLLIGLGSLSFWLAVVFSIMMIRDDPDGGIVDKWYEIGLAVCVFFLFAVFMCIDRVQSRLGWMRHHLGMKNLRSIIKLPPAQLKCLCIDRVQTLANELVATEKSHKNPLAEERATARWNMQRAYWFFVDHGYMHKMPWENFFKDAA